VIDLCKPAVFNVAHMKRRIPVLVLLLLVAACSCAPVTPPVPPQAVAGAVLSPDGVSIHYTAAGTGSPALVFVHGWSCDGSYWSNQVPAFARSHRVVAVDLGGHGQSGTNRADWTMQTFGSDVAAVVKTLELDPVILIGHSMGGAVIIEAARRLPDRVRALVAVDTLHDVEEVITEEQISAHTAPMREDFKAGAENMVRNMLFDTNAAPALVDQVATDMASAHPEIALSAMENLFRYDAATALETVKAPVRCIDCPLYPVNVEAGSRHATSYRVSIIEGVGHFPMLEDTGAFKRELEKVLRPFSGGDA